MGVDIDHSGKDMIINLGNSLGRMPIQIKKVSYRPESSPKIIPQTQIYRGRL